MGVEGLTGKEPADLAQLQKDSADRLERQQTEKDEYRKARQIRLGHVEEKKEKAKAKPKETDKESE